MKRSLHYFSAEMDKWSAGQGVNYFFYPCGMGCEDAYILIGDPLEQKNKDGGMIMGVH